MGFWNLIKVTEINFQLSQNLKNLQLLQPYIFILATLGPITPIIYEILYIIEGSTTEISIPILYSVSLFLPFPGVVNTSVFFAALRYVTNCMSVNIFVFIFQIKLQTWQKKGFDFHNTRN